MSYEPALPPEKPMMLLSAFYDGKLGRACLRFYDPDTKQVYFWLDDTGHKPYCYTKRQYADQLNAVLQKNGAKYSTELVLRKDVIEDEEIQAIKITAPDPLAIGSKDGIREKLPCWEADIRYHETFMFDRQLIVGAYYALKDGALQRHDYALDETTQQKLAQALAKGDDSGHIDDEYRQYASMWAQLLSQPIPDIKRLAVDIEVFGEEGRMPKADNPVHPITACGCVGSDGLHTVFIVNGATEEQPGVPWPNETVVCKDEKKLLELVFDTIRSYPVLLTFNGDDFDVPYLYMRALHLGIAEETIPLVIRKGDISTKRNGQQQAEATGIPHGIHIDVFRFLANRSIQIYAFAAKYKEFTLDAISTALLGEGKYDYDGELTDLTAQELATYCLKDAELTCRLTTFNNNIVMHLLVSICRIGRLATDDLSRLGINQWIRGVLYYEHRRRGELIPSYRELALKGMASTEALSKGKKYKGAFVADPKPGIYFNVVVVDFASLYPSIIKLHNLSHETVNCKHAQCRLDPANMIEGTSHWVCGRRRGLASLVIGSLRDLRVNYYKKYGKDKATAEDVRNLFKVVEQAIKVILNASYGVMGSEIFPLYCLPVADCTTAIGRARILATIDKCAELGLEQIYGDTDSVFLNNPPKDKLEQLIRWVKEQFGVDLEVDKQYRYVAFSDLKKNYLGVYDDGTFDVKGLTGKKSHTAPFVRKAFYDTLEILRNVHNHDEFAAAKQAIKKLCKQTHENLQAGKIPLEEMAMRVNVKKNLDTYGKPKKNGEKGSVPPHIKAAKQLVAAKKVEVRPGDRIAYVNVTTHEDNVKPVALATAKDIDVDKYQEKLESTLDQLLAPLSVTFKEMAGMPRQAALTAFWGAQK